MAVAMLEAVGVPAQAAEMTAAMLVRADLEGHGSHGVRLLPDYCSRCQSGAIDPTATPRIDRDDGSTVVLDGRRALGHVAGLVAADLAVERAREHGVAVVTMRLSGHLGRLAGYVERMAANGVVAVLVVNDSGANQVVAPHGSGEGRLATNPIAIGVPRPAPPHLVLDMATSATSHGTVEMHRLTGAALPEGWTVGDVLLPLGGAKGTGLALFVDVLAGVLSGAGSSREAPAHDYQGVWVLALDPGRFLAPGQLETETERLVRCVRSASPLPGQEVLVPGEPSARAVEAHLRDGIPVPAPVWASLCELATKLDVPIPDHRYEEPA
jgi:hydroxycarboxylate dehydrogenase B